MKRSIFGAVLGASLLLAPLAYAQTTSVPIGDPYTDTIQLWSEITSALSSLANSFAALLDGEVAATRPTTRSYQQGPAALAAAVASFETATTTATSSDQNATAVPSDTSVGSSSTENVPANSIRTNSTTILADPTTPINASNFVTQSELTAQLDALSGLLTTEFGKPSTTTPPQSVAADGNSENPFAAVNAIDQLSDVTISNSTIDAASIPNLSGSYLSLNGGTVTGAFADTATSSSYFLGDLGVGTSSPTTPLSVVGELSVTDTQASSTATLGQERISDGSFSSDPTSTWTLGSGWSWNSGSSNTAYAGSGGPISSITIASGGSGYTSGDTITISGGSGDATYTATVSGGVVTALTQVSAGTAYSATASGSTNATTGGTGSGLAVIINQIADSSSTLSQALTTSPSDPTVTYTTPEGSGDITYTGTPYRLSFTIQNYSGTGKIRVSFGAPVTTGAGNGNTSQYYGGNGTYTSTLLSTSTSVIFTPTGDFSGAITNISAKPITPLNSTMTINNSDGSPGIEFRPGGISEYTMCIGLRACNNYTTKGIYDEGFNTAIGYQSMYSNTGGDHNTALGIETLFSNSTGYDNIAIGSYALYRNTTGAGNTAVGFYPLFNNTTGGQNTAIGYQALISNTTGTFNSALGSDALYANTTGGNNTAMGYTALFGNKTGNNNVAVGYEPLYSNTTGSSNIAIGYLASNANTIGSNNTAVGYRALQSNKTGAQNAAVGFDALQYATTSSNNSAVGYLAMQGGTTGSLTISGTNDVAIGLQALQNYIDGSSNTAVGVSAMAHATTSSSTVAIGYKAGSGSSNNDAFTGLTAVGYQTGQSLSNGSNFNTLIGYQAGYNLTTGADNILIGSATSSNSNANLTTGSQNILIGENIKLASSTANGQLDIGNILFGSGVTGTVSTITGNIGIGTSTPYSRLEVAGTDAASSTSGFAVVNTASTTVFSVFDGGNAELSGSLSQSSDQRLKTNIQSLDASSSLSLIDSLNPVTFNWIDPNQTTTLQLGFIAQQVQQIFPNLVSTTSATALTPGGTLSLNYIGLISPVVSAIQALSAEIATIENTIADFAQSLTSNDITANNELCVGSTCVTPSQFQAMVAAADESGTATDAASQATDTPPVIQINGDNPAVVQVGNTYNDLGATITGPQQDLNLGITTYVNGIETNPVEIDTSAAATDTIDYVVTDQNDLSSTSTRTVIVEPTEAPSIVPTQNASTTTTSTAQ